MSFKWFWAAAASLFLAVQPLSIQARAEFPLSMSYSVDEEMYYYSFSDGVSFVCTNELSEDGVIAEEFWLAADAKDVMISVKRGDEYIEYSDTTVLQEAGEYTFTVSHELRSGDNAGEIQTIQFPLVIKDSGTSVVPDDTDSGEETNSSGSATLKEGRLELSPDGDTFTYTFSNGETISSNVLDGETVDFVPKVKASDGIECSVLRNGEPYALPYNGIINEDGAYSFEFIAYTSELSGEARYYSFTVHKAPMRQMGFYYPPEGAQLVSASKDGKPLDVSAGYVELCEDGDYTIDFRGDVVSRVLNFKKDTVAPVLYFNGTNMTRFESEVTVTTNCPCTVTAVRDGAAYTLSDDLTLKSAGIYIVTATDEAGNVSQMRVEIIAPSAVDPALIAVISGGALVAAVVYVIVQRRKGPVVR